MILFLHWIGEAYLPRKKGKKRKSLNQYWRDFKMLYRRINSVAIDTNILGEVVEVIYSSLDVSDRRSYTEYIAIVHQWYNGTLKDLFGLDTSAKSKLVAGSDDLLNFF